MELTRNEKAKIKYLQNRETILEIRKNYYKNNKDKILKRTWTRRGLILQEDETWDSIFLRYNNNVRCEKCNCEYSVNNKKCMDHSHISGYLRNVCCIKCNNKMEKLS